MKSKILLIEDNPDILESTNDFLTGEGFEVITAKNGILGIQNAIQKKPDLILCDISMPGFDGYEVYKILQQNKATALIPFIFLTAKNEKEDFRAGMQLGADDYITKPYDYDELSKTIKVRLEKHHKIVSTYKDQFQSFINSPITPVFIFQEEKVTFMNNHLLSLLEINQDEIIGQNYKILFSTESYNEFKDKYRKCEKKILDNFQINSTIKTKNKTLKSQVYCTYNEFESIPALIGTLTVHHEKQPNSLGKPITELAQAVEMIIKNQDYFTSQIKDEIAEIIDFNELKERKRTKVKEEIGLTKREEEVLSLICRGLTNHEIAENLFLSQRTVDTHRSNIISKTNTRNTAELVMFTVSNQLIDL